MRPCLLLAAICVISCTKSTPAPPPTSASADTAAVRRELEARYEENNRAFLAKDLEAIMALRTKDFHSVTPDSVVHDRAAMEERTQGLLNGIEKWISLSIDIESIELSGDLAHALTRQHVVRMALRPDGKVHHVETWVTQRETWRRTPEGWKLYRVDGLRDQKRLVDGKPG